MANLDGPNADEAGAGEGEDWLEHCVPWTGLERDLPAGVLGIPQTINILDLILSVTILDVQHHQLATIDPSLVKPGMKIANCTMWEDGIKEIGPDSIRIVDPDGGQQLTRKQWYDSLSADGVNPRHTDGMAMMALRKLRSKISGPGVVVG